MDSAVCNVRPLFISRFFYGYHCVFSASRRIQYLLKTYSVSVILATVLYLKYSYFYVPEFMILCVILEYFSYLFVSYWTKERYIVDYYQYNPRIDGPRSSSTYRSLGILIVVITVFHFLLLIFAYLLLTCFTYPNGCNKSYVIIIDSLILYCLDIGKVGIILVFALFYYRVRNFRNTFESHGFDNSPWGRYRPQKYIQMYETLLNTFAKVNVFIEPQYSVFLTSSSLRFLTLIFHTLSTIKEHGPSWLSFSYLFVGVLYGYLPVIVGAVLSDLISDNLHTVNRIVVEKKIECKNERERAEIQQLVVCMKHQPYQYTLYRIVPLTLRTLLSCASFCVTTLIAILQIKTLSS